MRCGAVPVNDRMRALTLSRLQFIGLAILAIALPFELKTPIVSLGPIELTNVEAILYALIVLWLCGVWRTRRIHWTLAHSAVFAWLVVQFLAAIFAPLERDAALKFALRSTGGVLLFFIAADVSRTSERTVAIMGALSLGAVLSALAGWLEYKSSAAQLALLIFKTQPTLVGGILRASGTFQYANTAAMYWEAALPIIIAVGTWWSIKRRPHSRRRWFALTTAASVIVIVAIILSASRAAIVGAGLALGIMIMADRISSSRSGVGVPAAFSLIALGVLIGAQLLINPIFTARLRSENDDSWFRADIRPAQAALAVSASAVLTTTVTVTNTSVQTWPATGERPVHVSYHWIQPASRRVLILDGARTALPHDLAPGEAATVSAWVQVPALTGTLNLQWDLVQEGVTWFGERGNPVAEVSARITSAQQAVKPAPPPAPQALSDTSAPPRLELWRAAVKMWLDYPLLGIGPDNFRHVYGQYLGQTTFDDRITANSWYLEVLATTGLIGVIAGLLVIVAFVITARRQWLWAMHSERILVLGLGVALLTFFMHGTVDYFMEFTPTYGLFWLTAGLFVGLLTGTRDVEFAGTADRV